MRSRRRSGNPLLWKMVGIAVLITAALLPVLAYLGAFKPGKGSALMQIQMIQQPPPKIPKQEHEAKKPNHKPQKMASRRAGHTTQQAAKPLPLHVAVAISGAETGNGNGVENGTNTNVGQVPTGPAPSDPTNTKPAPPVNQPPLSNPPAPVNPPTPVKPLPPPQPVAPPAPHVPVIVAAVPISDPDPSMPDDLLDQDIDTTCRVLLTINPDGTVTATKEKSSGYDELDSLAMDTVKKWRFKPATRDGVPETSYLHVDVDFTVS